MSADQTSEVIPDRTFLVEQGLGFITEPSQHEMNVAGKPRAQDSRCLSATGAKLPRLQFLQVTKW